MLDRAYGTGTMIMHINGALPPGTPVRREYMKSVTYVPPLVVKGSHTWEHRRIMNIAQEFLDVIGTRVITRYQDGVRMMNWNYRSTPNISTVSPNAGQKTLPMPTSSASITILGRPSDDLDQHSLAPAITSPTTSSLITPAITSPITSSPMTPSSTTHPDDITSLRLEVSRLRTSLQAAHDEIARLKAECVQHHTGSQDVLSTPRSNSHSAIGHANILSTPRSDRHVAFRSLDVLSTPYCNHRITFSSPSTLPHRPLHYLEDDQLPAYSDPLLDVPDIIAKYNIPLNVDDIVNTMENVDGQNWKCVLQAFDIDTNIVDELVDAMQRAKLN